MKKIALILGLAGFVTVSYGQGFVTVAGTQQNQTNTTALTTGWTGGLQQSSGTFGNLTPTGSGGAYSVELLTTTNASPINTLFGDANLGTQGNWLDTLLLGHNNTFAGRLAIGSDVAAANAPVGVNENWVLVAWTTSLGTWSDIQTALQNGNANNLTGSGYLGWSTIGNGAAGAASPAPALIIEGSPSPIIPGGFTLLGVSAAAPVPEPSTLALAALGGASLLLFRRRKV